MKRICCVSVKCVICEFMKETNLLYPMNSKK